MGWWSGGELYQALCFPIVCSAEGGGFLGLHGPRVSPAESGDSVRPEGVPDGQGGAPAEPPRPHAARPQEAHLRQRRGEAGQWLRSVFTQWLIKFPTFDRTCDSRLRQGFAQGLLKRMSQRSSVPGCGVTFEIVSNIPGVSTRTPRPLLYLTINK